MQAVGAVLDNTDLVVQAALPTSRAAGDGAWGADTGAHSGLVLLIINAAAVPVLGSVQAALFAFGQMTVVLGFIDAFAFRDVGSVLSVRGGSFELTYACKNVRGSHWLTAAMRVRKSTTSPHRRAPSRRA